MVFPAGAGVSIRGGAGDAGRAAVWAAGARSSPPAGLRSRVLCSALRLGRRRAVVATGGWLTPAAAVNTVRRAMVMDPEERDALYAIKVENTAAVSWFNGKTALDEEAQLGLENMDRGLDERGSKARAWWEPTRTEPADEPSKGKPICEDRARLTERVAPTQLKLTSFRTKPAVDFD